ncbi:hypothetical protein PGT21_034253 [Puccinia graminis f. sp. tritici]|uniref:Uncharacterized protein n=1 Tax=Puccinia graminis f. sp. tritici TaxID=56615 RepID=A0A5B0M5J1_PUCGR|nr:hypothetical protein PGT21_034253 [Puccinia graminis f. sp. tritici]KAA1120317.1 hypothetical protein PGTUg99_012678 [Puccinia graminis f. sp. tritici]
MSSAVTPSDSARHPSDACRSSYSSGRSWTGLSLPLLPLVCSEPRFRPSVPPLLVAPPQYTLNPVPQSAVNPSARIPRSKLFGTLRIRTTFPRFPVPRKARLSTNAPPLSSACVCSVSSACFPHQPRALRMRPNKLAKALVKSCSCHHTTPPIWTMKPEVEEENLPPHPSSTQICNSLPFGLISSFLSTVAFK